MSLTGIPERDFDILLDLDSASLINACQVSNYVNAICHDEYFWRQKVKRDFGDDVAQLKPVEETFRYQWNRLLKLNRTNPQVAARGYPDELTVLEKSGYVPGQDDVYYATREGHLPVLQWLAQRGLLPNEEAVDQAFINGHVRVLDWLESRGYQFNLDSNAANNAAWYCQIEVLNWLERRGILPTKSGANAAYQYCTPETLDWLAARGIFPDEED